MNEVLFSNERDDWETPLYDFLRWHDEFKFTVDVCASAFNAKCQRFYNEAQNGLTKSWKNECCWCNPPYSQINQWVEKASIEAQNGATVVMLIPARTDTRMFHDYIWDNKQHKPRNGVKLRFLKGRLKFNNSEQSAPFPSMLVIFKQ